MRLCSKGRWNARGSPHQSSSSVAAEWKLAGFCKCCANTGERRRPLETLGNNERHSDSHQVQITLKTKQFFRRPALRTASIQRLVFLHNPVRTLTPSSLRPLSQALLHCGGNITPTSTMVPVFPVNLSLGNNPAFTPLHPPRHGNQNLSLRSSSSSSLIPVSFIARFFGT